MFSMNARRPSPGRRNRTQLILKNKKLHKNRKKRKIMKLDRSQSGIWLSPSVKPQPRWTAAVFKGKF